jgi:hypothetical protein
VTTLSKNLVENGQIVELVRATFTRGSSGLANLPGLLKRVLSEDMWRERVIERTGEVASFESFQSFVEAPPLEGLGATIQNLLDLCKRDPEVVSLIDEATQRQVGRPQKTVDIINDKPDGTSRQQALRKLRKDRPDLHAKVISREVSPHAAMVAAGFRRRTITIEPTAAGFVKAARKHLTAEERHALVATLSNA